MPKYNTNNVLAHLKKKWGEDPLCPLCGVSDWGLSDSVFELREFHHGSFKVGGVPIMPIIPVSCRNCGNTVFVNAMLAGGMEAAKDEERTNGK